MVFVSWVQYDSARSKYDSSRPVAIEGRTGVHYFVTDLTQLDANLRSCNVPADRDLLLDYRLRLMLERDYNASSTKGR